MNAEQKRTWFSVITGIVCILGFLTLWPFVGPMIATAAFALFGITGFAGFSGRGEKPDERDKAIARRATLAGAMASYMVFILGCMSTWSVVYGWRHQGQVDVHILGTITCLGGFVFFFSRSVAILVLYGRRVEADDA